MNYLIALLAFSAIMIVLATLASVLVESIHRLLSTRSRDFEEMLTQLYKQSVRPHFKNAGVALGEEAETFVKEIRRNPAIAYNKKSLFNKYFVKTEFEELTTRQFVEQLAQSEAGQKLMQKVEQEENEAAAATISRLSYEFERYGQAATEYFKRRAAFLSIVVAFVLASTLNIDSLTLYGTLSRDSELAEQVVESIDVEKLQKAQIEAVKNVADDEAAKQTVNEKFDAIWDNYRQASAQLDGMALPIGHDFYPFCAGGSEIDPRCEGMKAVEKVQLLPVVDPALSWLKGFIMGVATVLTSQDGLVWLFRIIITTGLIGLGAPFWYKTYRSVGQLIPGRRHAASESTAERNQGLAGKPSSQANQPIMIGVQKPVVVSAPVEEAPEFRDESPRVSSRSVPSADSMGDVVAEKVAPPVETQVITTVPSSVPVQTKATEGLLKDDLVNIFKNTPAVKDVKENDSQ